jgi:heptosyltransferase III
MTGTAASIGSPRILIIRRDNIGDLVCTTPLISALRASFPQAFLAALVNSYNAAVLDNNPDLNAVYAYTKGKHLLAGESQLGALWRRVRLLHRLRGMRFDYVIVAGAPASAHALRLARSIRARHAIACVETQTPWVDMRVPLPVQAAHEVERTFALGAPLGISGKPRAVFIKANTRDLDSARAQLASKGIIPGRQMIVGIHISARKPSNRWPPERFADLMHRLHAQRGCAFVLLWAPGASDDPKHPGDDDKAALIVERARDLPLLALRTGALGELIGGLAACDYVICSDGGAMHVAAGLGKPIVCLFGNSDAARWRPWGVPHIALQTEARDAQAVEVEQVLDAFDGLMQQAPRDRGNTKTN